MRILVTGGAGFIGSHLIQALEQAGGHDIINVDEVNDYYPVEFKQHNLSLLIDYPRYTFYQKDINDLPAIEQIFQTHQPEVVVHLGARAGVRRSMTEPALYKTAIYGGTTGLATLANRYEVKQFIFGSTSAVYGNRPIPFTETATDLQPVSEYAKFKLMAEQWLQLNQVTTKLPTTILRFFTVYGERGRPDMAPYLFTEAILRGQTIKKFGDGTTSRDYTYINDIVSGIMAAIQHPFDFEIINLGNHQAVSLNDFIATLEDITQRPAQIESVPGYDWDAHHTLADISKAQRVLGYQPTTTLRAGLQRFVDWYRINRL
ncbi:MAG: NAD-dependent epimerase/dehydratase family protein [Candidatus Kerfeldbacteria bacterium]|nr:NAD-dependent epimerase/dehydratase family protein [Candidatus Kerfeldbacteria bacterium]